MNKEYIIFYVEDSGIQIEQQYLEKIFDHLYIYSEQEKPDILRGSGIDLAFAKTVTELLGGRIWAESNEKYNRFLFSLPYKSCKTKTENKNIDKVKSPYRWPGKLIIVAEDEDSNFQLIEAMLRDTEVTILRANDGIHLLELVEKENHIDLVLLDIQMPRMNGINAMQIIRDSNKELPVIAQTAFDQEHYRKKAKEQGFINFIVKPIRKSDLLEAIQKCLG